MSILWDESQLVSLVDYINKTAPIKEGTLQVMTADIPENSFAGKVSVEDKIVYVYIGLNESMADGIVNIFMGYALALAYSLEGWIDDSLSDDTIAKTHSSMCDALEGSNPEFAKAMRGTLDLVTQWYHSHIGDIVESNEYTAIYEEDNLTLGLLSPSDSNDYGAN